MAALAKRWAENTLRAEDINAFFDVKAKAAALGTGAQKEYQKASAAAQAKAGTIELYSAKYYAACTLGGLLACVSLVVSNAGVKGY